MTLHPAPTHTGPDWELTQGDLLDELPRLPETSVDSIVTDPPYGLEFMGKDWDRFRLDDPGTKRNRGERAGAQGGTARDTRDHPAAATRVSYGGVKRPTTSRCATCGKRDQFRNPHACTDPEWIAELIHEGTAPPGMLAFQNWCTAWGREALRVLKPGGWLIAFGGTRTVHRLATGLEDAGFEIRDLGLWIYRTGFPKSRDSLKPSWEPWVVARRPIPGTVKDNVATWGTGLLNLDECRGAYTPEDLARVRAKNPGRSDTFTSEVYGSDRPQQSIDENGRWPGNIATLDPLHRWNTYQIAGDLIFDTPKAPSSERPTIDDEGHPTVKPLALMRHLVRLTTPHGGLVLDPFAGSGTTLEAALAEGRRAAGLDLDPEGTYIPLALQRLNRPIEQGLPL